MDASTLVSAFHGMLDQLASAFTRPTAATFRQLTLGWVLTPAVGTITGVIRTLGAAASKHWTVYEKFFYRAVWSLDTLSLLILTKLIAPMLGPTIHLAVDDTTCGPRGKHVALAGWYKDASAHAQKPVIHWAHNWVILSVILRPQRQEAWRVSLPVVFALHRKKKNCSATHPHFTLPQLARQLVERVSQAVLAKRIIVTMDGAYATRDFFGDLPANVTGISRLRKDAALRTAVVPSRRSGRGGRPRLRGDRLPSLGQIARNVDKWKTVKLSKQGRVVRRRIHGFTCQWYHVCGSKPVRVVIVQGPAGGEDELHLVCTDPALSDKQIVQESYDRWGIEECIQDAKQSMGLERVMGWCEQTVSRQVPLAMLWSTLVKVWYVQHVTTRPRWQQVLQPWYRHKRSTSFRNMLGALRHVLWETQLKENSRAPCELNKLPEALVYALCEAA